MTLSRLLIVDRSALEYRDLLGPEFPNLRIDVATSPEDALPLAPFAEAIFVSPPNTVDRLFSGAGRLRWIQALTSGTDAIEAITTLHHPVVVTSARGVQGPQVAEMAFLHMLMLSRQAEHLLVDQRQAEWFKRPQRILWRKTIAVVGSGVIACELASRCKAFGMTVLGVSRSVRPIEHFDRIYDRADLLEPISEADFVVLILPYDQSSHRLIAAPVFKAMRKTAYLINLARGGVIDEVALLEALDKEEIAGAGLDVATVEPMQADHPFWRHPKILVTPHIAGWSDIYPEQVTPILKINLRAFSSGQTDAMVNRVHEGGLDDR